MKLNIIKIVFFYILMPADVDTGGPHDLIQLGFELQNLGN